MAGQARGTSLQQSCAEQSDAALICISRYRLITSWDSRASNAWLMQVLAICCFLTRNTRLFAQAQVQRMIFANETQNRHQLWWVRGHGTDAIAATT